jgi:hypothetical protein
MKTKKFNKKLSLNKETISHLNSGQLQNVYGGGENQEDPLPATNSCLITCTCNCTGSCNTQCNSACSNACC